VTHSAKKKVDGTIDLIHELINLPGVKTSTMRAPKKRDIEIDTTASGTPADFRQPGLSLQHSAASR